MKLSFNNPWAKPWSPMSKAHFQIDFTQLVRIALVLALMLVVVAPDVAFASQGGCQGGSTDPFCGGSTGVYQTLKAWSQGGLGLFLSLLSLVVGLAGAARIGSLFPVVIGVCFALAFSQGPTVLESVMGATL